MKTNFNKKNKTNLSQYRSCLSCLSHNFLEEQEMSKQIYYTNHNNILSRLFYLLFLSCLFVIVLGLLSLLYTSALVMLSRCLLNGEKNSESATACGLQRSQTRKRTFSLLTAVVAGNTGWEELQGSKLSSCIHFGHWFTRIFYHILLLRPRPCIFGVTSLRMTSLRLMKKVNFQNCHHSNMYIICIKWICHQAIL